MKMNDEAVVVAISPDAKYIAVALLLDYTVKVRCLNLSCSVCNLWFPKTKINLQVLLCSLSFLFHLCA